MADGLAAVEAGEVEFIDAAIVVAIVAGGRDMTSGLVTVEAGEVEFIDTAIVVARRDVVGGLVVVGGR